MVAEPAYGYSRMEGKQSRAEEDGLEQERPVAVEEDFGERGDAHPQVVCRKNRRASEAVRALEGAPLEREREECRIKIEHGRQIHRKKPHDHGADRIEQHGKQPNVYFGMFGKDSRQKDGEAEKQRAQSVEGEHPPVTDKGRQHDVD